jgi:hypothetical protein
VKGMENVMNVRNIIKEVVGKPIVENSILIKFLKSGFLNI